MEKDMRTYHLYLSLFDNFYYTAYTLLMRVRHHVYVRLRVPTQKSGLLLVLLCTHCVHVEMATEHQAI